MRLFLLRHGQTSWNSEGRAQGHVDVGLDALGEAQAQRAAEALRRREIKRILSSDLIRCRQSAEPLSQLLGIEVEVRPALRERNFGVLEGQHYTSLRVWFQGEARVQGLTEFELRPDDGESVKDVWKRLEPIEREIKRSQDSMAIFLHGGTCALLVARLMNGTVETSRSLRFENAAITEMIRRPDGFWQLLKYNESTHLEGLNGEDRTN